MSSTTAGRRTSARLRNSPEGPRNSRYTDSIKDELISRCAGRLRYSSGTLENVESSGSLATSTQISTATASDISFQPK